MADTIFCLDIHEDRIGAVNVDTSTGATVVSGCSREEMGQIPFAETLEKVQTDAGFEKGSCRVSFGAEYFSFRNISLPFRDKGKISQILPLELDDLMPYSIDAMVIDFVITQNTEEGVKILAAMIDREVLTDCLVTLAQAGIDPDTVGISGVQQALFITGDRDTEFVFLDVGSKWATIIIVEEGNIRLIRSIPSPSEEYGEEGEPVFGDFVRTVHQTLLMSNFVDTDTTACSMFISASYTTFHGISHEFSTLVENATIKRFDLNVQPHVKLTPEVDTTYRPEVLDSALSLAFKGRLKQSGFNFRRGALKKRKSLAEYRKNILKFAVPACLIFVCGLGYWFYTFTQLRAEQDNLKQQITAVFKKTLPEVTRIINPVQQLTVINKEIMETYRPGGLRGTELTMIDVLAEISSRISPDHSVKVVRFVADMEVIRIKAQTKDFNTVDVVQKELEKSPYFTDVSISSANQSLQGDEVSFELKLLRTL